MCKRKIVCLLIIWWEYAEDIFVKFLNKESILKAINLASNELIIRN